MLRLLHSRLLLGGAVTALTLSACGGSTAGSSAGAATSAPLGGSTGTATAGASISSSGTSEAGADNGWTGAKLDACSLLTLAQATSLGGRPIVSTTAGATKGGLASNCQFNFTNSFGHEQAAFSVSVVYPPASVRAMLTPTQFMDRQVSATGYKPLPGVGDQAVEATNDKGNGFWQGRRGGTVLLVGAFSGGVSRTQGEAVLQAALTAVG